jgi:hypothetical protein
VVWLVRQISVDNMGQFTIGTDTGYFKRKAEHLGMYARIQVQGINLGGNGIQEIGS